MVNAMLAGALAELGLAADELFGAVHNGSKDPGEAAREFAQILEKFADGVGGALLPEVVEAKTRYLNERNEARAALDAATSELNGLRRRVAALEAWQREPEPQGGPSAEAEDGTAER